MKQSQTSQKLLRGVYPVTFVLAILCACVTITNLPAQAQTYTVLHAFTDAEGAIPTSTLIFDRAGKLYGTTEYGGPNNQGGIFQLKPAGSGWVYSQLHNFGPQLSGGVDPVNYGGLTIGPDGTIYGTTASGGLLDCGQSYCGLVFRLRPPATVCKAVSCLWNYTVVHPFAGDVKSPMGSIIFDQAGNMYGTGEFGSFYKLSPSGGSWNESNIYNSAIVNYAGMVVDSQGNLYAVSAENSGADGNNYGAVIELSPTSSGYVESVIYQFNGSIDGATPIGGLTIDAAGNLYGSTSTRGSGGGGTIFELSPSGSGWTFHVICELSGIANSGPQSALTLDSLGNLYGTTYTGGANQSGSVVKASRNGNNWTCSDLHDFEPGSNGLLPVGGVTLDSQGNLYGTTTAGGNQNQRYPYPGDGVIWEITQ